jgi:hypothetical protein
MNISSWMVDIAWVAARTGVNTSGDPQYAARRQVMCRLEVGNKLVIGAGAGGTNLNATHWIVTQELINPDDRVWLPSLGGHPRRRQHRAPANEPQERSHQKLRIPDLRNVLRMSGGVTITGKGAVVAALKQVLTSLPDKAKAAILQEAYALQAESQKQCPVEYGLLRASAKTAPTADGAKVSYGTQYAVYVHERVELHHPVGKAKFLEDPLNAMRVGYLERLQKRIAAMG